jgi:Ca-activated chloride channel family protein
MMNYTFAKYTFAYPQFFYLFILMPFLIGWYIWSNNRSYGEFRISSSDAFKGYRKSIRQRLRHGLFLLRLLSLSAIIVALARPQSSSNSQRVNTEGIDIMLAIDISPSMLAEDLKPNRIEAAKKVALDFIDSRPNDRIGLVVFAGESFTQCPLTSDHSVLKNLFSSIQSGQISDGTALGEGLATAVNRIKGSPSKSKVVILLTDGVNNSGAIPPLTAGEIAEAFKVRVYTIGVGTHGFAPYPMQTPYGVRYENVEVQIDEATMKQIAEMTHGKYFRASNNKKLKAIYQEIDKLEKTKIKVTEFRKHAEEYLPLALAAAALLILEILLRYTLFRSIT